VRGPVTVVQVTASARTVAARSRTATGGAPAYSFQLVGGTLPTGIGLSGGGHLSGTSLASGNFAFSVGATDSNGCAATKAYAILIIPTSCPALNLFPPILPNGSRGVAYQQTVLVTTGIAPFAYAVSAGTLPAGLVLNAATGVVSGTPTTLGESSFTITATDAAGCTESLDYTMTILPDFRGTNCGLFGDSFEDDALAGDWTYVKPSWSESGGNLIGTTSKKAIAIASPAFAGCLNCEIETLVKTSKAGDTKVMLLGWYVDSKNMMELSASAGTDQWKLVQRVGGNIVSTAKATKRIDTNVFYTVRLAYDGTKFDLFVDDLVTPLLSLIPRRAVLSGTVGFQAKGTTGTFGYICVN